jgi:N-acetylneuraminate epimerase
MRVPGLLERLSLRWMIVGTACFGVGALPMDGEESGLRFPLRWERWPALPVEDGLSGGFSGVSQGVLLYAGGTNFPGLRPWEGGTKSWYDAVYVLEPGRGRWAQAGHFGRRIGYGVSVSDGSGVVCVGGGDGESHTSGAVRIVWRARGIIFEKLPELPKPLAYACGALVGREVCVVGGIETPGSSEALRSFYALDLEHPEWGWLEREPLPGAGRILAVAGESGGVLYVFGGADLRLGREGKVERIWLRDGYAYQAGNGWRRVADLPRALVAAPSPAVRRDSGKLSVLGGDDGSQLDKSPEQHAGFGKTMLTYDCAKDAWSLGGGMPFSVVTTPTVEMAGGIVVPGGEVRPGVRSAEVWMGRPWGKAIQSDRPR